jgi:hypothetical protein
MLNGTIAGFGHVPFFADANLADANLDDAASTR